MAISFPPWHETQVSDPYDAEFNFSDIAIGGKLVQAKLELTTTDQMRFQSDDDFKRAIKQKIASELARAMIESNSIEFTRLPQTDYGNDIIYARCYLAPDNQVKLLRTHYADKK